MAITPIDALPPAPSRADPTTFATKGDTFLAALVNTFTPQLNTAISAINSAQSAADSDAAAASVAASNAAAAANSAQQAAGAVAWVSGSTYQQNAVAISQINFLAYRKKTTSATDAGGATDPANDGTNWVPLATGQMKRSSRTSNTTLTSADAGSLVDITSGTFTQTFSSASALGAGWFCFIRNSGSGYVTLDSTLFTNVVMMPGEVRIVQCDGTNFNSVLLNTEGYLHVRDEKASGTSGGTASAGQQTRALNAVKANTVNASLSSNQVTLPPGTYRFKIRAPASNVTSHKAWLYNVTDSTIVMVGSSEYSSSPYLATWSTINGVFTITSSKAVSVVHYCSQLSSDATALGYGVGSGQVEVYTEAEFWKIA